MKSYNKKVKDLFAGAFKAKAGEVGIEIEVEGEGLIHGGVGPYWHYHQDGSLRGKESAEYVLIDPIDRRLVIEALDKLFLGLEKNGAKLRKNSPNTSVHVHLNVQEWTLKKTYNLIVLWYILEHTLLEWCGDERIGNLFCLRGSDAELQIIKLATACKSGRYDVIAHQDGLRYSALNYTALSKFGSLEFRPLAGVYDTDVIHTWVQALCSLKDFADKFDNPTEIIQEFSRSGPEDFFKEVLPGALGRTFQNKTLHKQLHSGMRLIQNLAYCVAWEKDTPGEKKKEPLEKEDWVTVDEVPDWNPEILQLNIGIDEIRRRRVAPQRALRLAVPPRPQPVEWWVDEDSGDVNVGPFNNPDIRQHPLEDAEPHPQDENLIWDRIRERWIDN